MRKNLFILGAVLAAFTSCSNDDIVEVNMNNVITFDTHVNKNTRAVNNTTTGGLKKFYVFGSHNKATDLIFDNVEVKKNEVTGNWEYDNPVVWTNNQYNFAAYATGNISERITVTYNDNNNKGGLIFNDIVANDANDIVAAATSVNNTELSNPTVDLTFKHLHSKVQFAIKNGTSSYKMKVSDITFKIKKQGDCVFSNDNVAKWTAKGENIDLTFKAKNSDTAEGNAVFESEDHIVIPNQDLTDVNASFTVEFYNNADQIVDTRTFTDIPLAIASGNWQPGYCYKYTGTATSTIKFSVSVEEWEDKTITSDISL